MMNTTNRNLLLDLFQRAGRGRKEAAWEENIDFELLLKLMIRWWADYKAFEREDTVADAYREQRLTVKGMDQVWEDKVAFKGSDGQMHRYLDPQGKAYPLDKGLKGIRLRMDSRNFMPDGGGDSQKTSLGLHDTSTGLMNPTKKISAQQYKKLDAGSDNVTKKIYAFMPLSHPEDQALFQMLNDLAKRVRQERPQFHMLVRFYRANMTRIKLAAEHDMSTNFSLAVPQPYKINSVGETVPKLRFGLLAKTDATKNDEPYLDEPGKTALQKGLRLGKIVTVPTTAELLAARQQAAINYRQLVLDKWRYGEMVIAYREHEGRFPVFTMFSPEEKGFVVGTVTNDVWTAKKPRELIPDVPG